MRSKSATLSILLVLFFAMLGLGQSPAPLDGLSWLTGCWEGRQGEAIVEEHWSKTTGGAMLGFGRLIKDNKVTSYEFLQIREENGVLTYLPQPQGRPQVPFKLVQQENDKYVFENLAHDYPKRIVYQRQGKMLLASLGGVINGKPEREEFLMRRTACVDVVN